MANISRKLKKNVFDRNETNPALYENKSKY